MAGNAAPVKFTMPLPPSTNVLFRNVPGKGRVRTQAYDDWAMMAKVAVRQQRVPRIAGRCIINFGFELKSMQADIDNRLKAGGDLLVSMGIIEDDSLIVALTVCRLPFVNALAHVEIRPVEKTVAVFHPSQNGASGAWVYSAPSSEKEPDHGDQAI